ncbi:MAG: dephospho-CoA kinase [Myxococcales bacterium]|nr:MAG: dephospho-CoA kinase [Myxococcales bacterium]
MGATIIDADAIAREVVARGTPGLALIAEQFGPELLTPEGDLDRPRMAGIVFGDPEQLKRLEAITHPLIAARIAELQAEHADGVVIHDHPLLVESGLATTMDRVIVVDIPEELQVERAVGRGMSEEDARARMAHQATREQRLAAATDVIDNSGSLEELRAQVERLYADLA